MTMRYLLEQAWAIYENAEREHLPHLVRPSLPILYFGDEGRYQRSVLRAITVGLNPSKREFPPDEPFQRFPAARHVTSALLDGSPEAYRKALDDYFRILPYEGWFKPSFEELLRGLGASFFDGAGSAALHTDLCSPLATDPTWSQLGHGQQSALFRDGNDLWHALVEYLQPDVVLISVKVDHLAKILFPLVAEARPVYTVDTVDRERPYTIELSRRRLASGKEPFFVFGQAAQLPFGLISGTAKRTAGALIREAINGGQSLFRPVHPSRW